MFNRLITARFGFFHYSKLKIASIDNDGMSRDRILKCYSLQIANGARYWINLALSGCRAWPGSEFCTVCCFVAALAAFF